MAGNRHDHGEPEVIAPDVELGHEERDVNAWAVGKFGIGLMLLCIFALALLVGFFKYLESTVGPRTETALPTPPQPRLETDPTVDLKAMRDAEDSILSGYGWVDQSKGVVRIPIDVAIDLVSQRGLPARPQNGVQSASDASVPVESGLGEKVQQVGGPLAGASK
jgi:hypothetical protein